MRRALLIRFENGNEQTLTFPNGYYQSDQYWRDFVNVILNADEVVLTKDLSHELRWVSLRDPSEREIILKDTRERLDADPANPKTSADIPDDISDNDLYMEWLRS